MLSNKTSFSDELLALPSRCKQISITPVTFICKQLSNYMLVVSAGSKQQAFPAAVIPEPAQGSASTATVSGPGFVSGSATADASDMSCASSALGSSQFANPSTSAAHSDTAGCFNFVGRWSFTEAVTEAGCMAHMQ